MSRRSTRSNLTSTEIMGAPSMPTHVMPSVAATPAGSSLHLQNYYSHPANTRLLLGNVSQGTGKNHHFVGGALPKPPKPPEKPLIPYMRYSRKVWDEVKTSNPELKLWEIGKIIGQQWRELPSVDKQQFTDEYEVEKIEHLEQLKQYHSSPAYQAYLHAKSRAEAMEAAETLADKDDAYMSIEPTDDGADDSDLSCSVKHVAAARFQRNHRLINDILGETMPVPSTKSIVTSSRLGVLKNQVHSLELHRKKLEAELAHLEDAFVEKKRKMTTLSDNFGKEMKRLRSITPQEYYQEYKLKQQQSAAAQAKSNSESKKKDEPGADDKDKEVKAEKGEDPATQDKKEENPSGKDDTEIKQEVKFEDKAPEKSEETQMETDEVPELSVEDKNALTSEYSTSRPYPIVCSKVKDDHNDQTINDKAVADEANQPAKEDEPAEDVVKEKNEVENEETNASGETNTEELATDAVTESEDNGR